jgi:hypothetical protein
LAFYKQLIFFIRHINKAITGTGMGNFRQSWHSGLPGWVLPVVIRINLYISSRDFMANHLDLYLNYFSKRAGFHSLTNSPFSVYDQMLAEYGLIGLLLFAVYYLGFFARHYKALTYGLPLLLLMLAVVFYRVLV